MCCHTHYKFLFIEKEMFRIASSKLNMKNDIITRVLGALVGLVRSANRRTNWNINKHLVCVCMCVYKQWTRCKLNRSEKKKNTEALGTLLERTQSEPHKPIWLHSLCNTFWWAWTSNTDVWVEPFNDLNSMCICSLSLSNSLFIGIRRPKMLIDRKSHFLAAKIEAIKLGMTLEHQNSETFFTERKNYVNALLCGNVHLPLTALHSIWLRIEDRCVLQCICQWSGW